VVGELAAELGRVEVGLTLGVGHVTEGAEGAGDEAATILGECAEVAESTADLLPLGRGETLHGLGVGEGVLALLGVHGIELGKPVVHALLDVGLKLTETRLGLQGVLLLVEREITVRLHPLREVLVVCPKTAGSGGVAALRMGGRRRLALDGRRGLGSGSLERSVVSAALGGCGGEGERANEDSRKQPRGALVRRAEWVPGWSVAVHVGCRRCPSLI